MATRTPSVRVISMRPSLSYRARMRRLLRRFLAHLHTHQPRTATRAPPQHALIVLSSPRRNLVRVHRVPPGNLRHRGTRNAGLIDNLDLLGDGSMMAWCNSPTQGVRCCDSGGCVHLCPKRTHTHLSATSHPSCASRCTSRHERCPHAYCSPTARDFSPGRVPDATRPASIFDPWDLPAFWLSAPRS